MITLVYQCYPCLGVISVFLTARPRSASLYFQDKVLMTPSMRWRTSRINYITMTKDLNMSRKTRKPPGALLSLNQSRNMEKKWSLMRKTLEKENGHLKIMRKRTKTGREIMLKLRVRGEKTVNPQDQNTCQQKGRAASFSPQIRTFRTRRMQMSLPAIAKQ